MDFLVSRTMSQNKPLLFYKSSSLRCSVIAAENRPGYCLVDDRLEKDKTQAETPEGSKSTELEPAAHTLMESNVSLGYGGGKPNSTSPEVVGRKGECGNAPRPSGPPPTVHRAAGLVGRQHSVLADRANDAPHLYNLAIKAPRSLI